MKITKVERARRARIKAGKAKASDIYTSKHWSRMYREAKKFAKQRGITNPYGSRQQYIDAYISAKQSGEANIVASIRRGIRQTVPDRHSISFFDYQYQKMQRYARDRGMDFPWRSKREFISDYRSTKMSGVDRPLDEMRYFLKYKTSYRVALAEYRMAKKAREEWRKRKEEHEIRVAEYQARIKEKEDVKERLDAGEVFDMDYLEDLLSKTSEEPGAFEEEEPFEYSFKELKEMSTKEFAESNKEMLREQYHQLRGEGMTSKEAKNYVSAQWFGSP